MTKILLRTAVLHATKTGAAFTAWLYRDHDLTPPFWIEIESRRTLKHHRLAEYGTLSAALTDFTELFEKAPTMIRDQSC